MGNAMSDTEDDGLLNHGVDAEDDATDEDDNGESDTKPKTDISHLFADNATLRAAASKVKEKVPENVILQYSSQILQWLETKQERQEDSVTLAQFCEMLMEYKGVERVDSIKAFHQFDFDGSGVADVAAMVETLEQYSSRGALGELSRSVRVLQSCSLTPGFVDVYAGASDPVDKHGIKILQYLLRNRSETQHLPFPYLTSFNIVHVMRTAVLNSLFEGAKEEVRDPDAEKDMTEMERRTVHNCYSSLEVSSNPTGSLELRHNNAMYWQSEGAARSHWIRLHIKPGIIIKHLSIGVAASDESYMPELVTISVGQSSSKLSEIKAVQVDKHFTGRVVLLHNMKEHYPYIQVNIKRCHVDGCDTRIHGIKAVGYKLVKEQGITVMDVSAMWFLQMLTSTINFNLPQSPMMRSVLLGHTKKALEYMPPLVLSPSSSEKPAFLSKHVLQEVETFAQQLAFSPDSTDGLSTEGIQVMLALNLACGGSNGLLNLLSHIIQMPNLSLPCAELLAKANTVKNNCLEKLSTSLTVSYVGGDGGRSGTEPSALVDSSSGASSSSEGFITADGKRECTLIFEAEQRVQLTKIRIQVGTGGKGPKCGFVFVYNADSIPELGSKFDVNEHITYLSKYDFWRQKEFDFSVNFRNAGLGGLADNPVAYFELDKNCDVIDVSTQWGAVGKYIVVKFLEPRHMLAQHLSIVSLKFFGMVRPVPLSPYQKSLAVPDASKKPNCELPEICSHVLTFVSEIASEQVKHNKGHGVKPQFEFLDLSELNLTMLWDLYLTFYNKAESEPTQGKVNDLWYRCSIYLLQLIHGLIPVLAVSKNTTEAGRDALFEYLCEIVNSQVSEEDGETPSIYAANRFKLVRQIIIDGAPLFFPEKSKKRMELFKLLQSVSEQSGKPSVSLVFQSLCQFFSSVDPRGFLELPHVLTQDFSAGGALELMKSLLSVTCKEIQNLQLYADMRAKQRQEAEKQKLATESSIAATLEKEGSTLSTHQPGSNYELASNGPAMSVVETLPNGDALNVGVEEKLASAEDVNVKASTEKETGEGEKEGLPGKCEIQSDTAVGSPSPDSLVEATSPDTAVGATTPKATSSSVSVTTKNEKEQEEEGRMVYLINLAASLQTALFSWLWQQLNIKEVMEDPKLYQALQMMIRDYTQDVAQRAHEFFQIFKTMSPEDLEAKASKDEPSFLNIITRQLMLLLSTLVDKLDIETKVALLQIFKKLVTSISEVAKGNPNLFLSIYSDRWDVVGTEETVLRTWEIESPHPYHNHSNIVQVFNCPGASKIVVDFDSRCATERRYDYLNFTDSKGLNLRFDQKVGTTKWPRKVTFSGPHVHMVFHSDSSNTDWGYKFTATAHGPPDVQTSWLFDLQLGLVKVLGQLSGATLSSNPIVPQERDMLLEDSSELDILRSNLWTSLFRGGYMVGKLQRSLSGKFATNDDSRVHALLTEVVNVASGTEPTTEEDVNGPLVKQAKKLHTKCSETSKAKSAIRVGGVKVDEAVASLFAALVWHCQSLREDVEKFLNNGLSAEVSDGIIQAYSVAESVRLSLASERQKWNSQEDSEKDLEADPAKLFSSKAMYLLRFAGLTKVQLRNEMRSKFYKQMQMKKPGNKQPGLWLEGMDKYPSFRLVLEFIQDPAWTAERVHQMLQERSKFASAISEVYMFASNMLRVMSHDDPFQIPVVLYFREMFEYQHMFARHYADGLDGCGLSQEGQVRQGYYSLVRRFVEAFRQGQGQPRDRKVAPAYDLLQCILLHLLDVEWQPYDLHFVSELQLPQLLINFAKETVKMRDLCTSEIMEEEELDEYKRFMNWFKEVSEDDFHKWYNFNGNIIGDKKALQWFVARFSDVLDVDISCDGCGVTLPGPRYRCMQCHDMDLCTACFSGGVEPEDHVDTHEIVHLVFKCNHCQGFIVNTRIHCNQCDDFDLCLGCHIHQKFPPGHTEKHDVTKIPMLKLKTSPASSSSLQAYIHQHSWLLYASLTLSLSNAIYSQDTGLACIDHDYLRVAGQLQQQCLAQALHCLDQVSNDADGETDAIVSSDKHREQAFGTHSQERIMGLIGAVIPSDLKKDQSTEAGYNFCTEDFLNRLLRVSSGDKGHELNTQHLALRLMGRLLSHSDTKVADISTQGMASVESKSGAANIPGLQTVSHLFSFGAKVFERSGLEWACSVARMLEMLFDAHQWQQAMQQYMAQCVQALKQNTPPSSIFPMFVIAGFPEVLTTGSLVEYTYTSLETQTGVVLKHFPDKYQTLVVDLKTRKRHTVKDQQVTCITDISDVLETESVSKLVSFVIETTSRIQQGGDVSVETLWVLSLVLKALNRCFQSEAMIEMMGMKIFSGTFVQSLVSLGCKGTGLNQSWLLKDLEVLSLIWYTHDGSTSSKKNKLSIFKKNKGGKHSKKHKKKPSGDDDEPHDSDGTDDGSNSLIDLTEAMDLEEADWRDNTDYEYEDDDEANVIWDSDDAMAFTTDDENNTRTTKNKGAATKTSTEETDASECEDGDRAWIKFLKKYDSELSSDVEIWGDAPTSPSSGGKDGPSSPPDRPDVEKVKDKDASPKPGAKKETLDNGGDTAGEGTSGASATPAVMTSESKDKISVSKVSELDSEFKKKLLKAIESKIPKEILQSACSNLNGDSEAVLEFLLENFASDEGFGALLKKWGVEGFDIEQKESSSNESVAIDKGISAHPAMDKSKRKVTVAVDERGDNPQDLFQQQEGLTQEINERLRGKSAQLLKKELEQHGRSGSQEYLHKVNLAMCVLYARLTLTSLLAHWPDDGPAIDSSLMGCKDVRQIPSVLDLLHKMDSKFFFSKVVDKVIQLCDPASLKPIAFSAAQFMEEISLQAVSCESTHDYTNMDKKKGQIQLPGATYLTVTFDSRCATEEDDILKFSNTQKMGETVYQFSGSSPAKWSSFNIPGDTLFYRFCLDDYQGSPGLWGYKFTVTPGICDSFETGHTILKAALSSSVASSLPLGQLWSSLVYVACKQPGLQRLKAINLMLKIVALQSKAKCGDKSKTSPDIKLDLLKPLWQLYRNLTQDDADTTNASDSSNSSTNQCVTSDTTGTTFQSVAVRALTDLFLHVEDLVCEWDITESYLVSLIDENYIYKSIVKGLTHVAALGLQIGHQNVAIELIRKVRLTVDNKVKSTVDK